MKCPYCGQVHPDSARYCENTGEPLLKACKNEDCPDFGKHILPLEAKFCPCCGRPIQKGAGCSQIVVVCSKDGSFIQIGRIYMGNILGILLREKRIKLKKGENVISVEEYPELQYGFSFYKASDKPEQIEDIILNGFDTSKVTDMGYMFKGCSSLVSLDLSGFDTSNVTDMGGMFDGCSSLMSLDLSGFDTSKVNLMDYMFNGCSSLKSLDLSGFDTSNVIDICVMFGGCSSLKSLDLSGFDTSNVTNMFWMFRDCSSLKSLDLSGFDTSNVTDMSYMFKGCSSLVSLDLSGFDTSNVTNMDFMFEGCSEEIKKEYEYLL